MTWCDRLGDDLKQGNDKLQGKRHEDESGESSAKIVAGGFHCFILRMSARQAIASAVTF